MKREDLTNEQIDSALKLLTEAAEGYADMESAPHFPDWWKRYFELNGAHMILTEEGWEHGSGKAAYEEMAEEDGVPISDLIRDEVNAPVTQAV